MKKILVILLFITAKTGFSQTNPLIGKYLSNDNYLNLTDSIIEFKTSCGSGLLITIYGYGTYKIVDNKIQVNTFKPAEDKSSSYQVTGNLNYSNAIDITLLDSISPISYTKIAVLENKKVITVTDTDTNGHKILKDLTLENSNNTTIKFALLGYDTFEIPLNQVMGKSIKVFLRPYRVLKGETVLFDIVYDNGKPKIIGPIFPETKEIRKYKKKRNFRMICTSWPWNWNFKTIDESVTTEFVKQ